MKIFITGGSGFIGTYLCKKLASLHKVTVYDNFSNSSKENFPVMENVTLIFGDILDNSKLLDSMKNHDIVIHLAAKTDVIDSIRNSDNTFQTNVQGTQNVIDSCKSNNISKIIITSSAAVYQNSDNSVDEASATKPLSPYGQSKLDMENIAVKSEINYSILRLFNVYGNGQTSGVIATFRKNILENTPLTIFGDGKAIRDFIYIDDVVDAIILCMKSTSGIYNIASGYGTSISNLSKLLIQLSGKNSEIIYKSARGGEIIYSVANIIKSKKELGFYTKISLKNGLSTL
ncbi:NAD-dependent epimerase/dehydratase family protein [Nitrosopumilus sp.]|jgi:UDP-glucose 4-epimerase|nr:NAD-dependent epimerase/dehydratase family protein [Nitrosopumilus sp.]